jgi:hypothetical protein
MVWASCAVAFAVKDSGRGSACAHAPKGRIAAKTITKQKYFMGLACPNFDRLHPIRLYSNIKKRFQPF